MDEGRRGVPFSARVTTAAWLDDARAWVAARAGEAGMTVVGTPEQLRVRPWSTQLVVATDRGRLWLKAGCRSAAHEPAVQAVLADVAPGRVDAPLAIDADRGWMLTRDQGPTLRATREATEADWRALVTGAVEVQRRAFGDGVPERLREAGLPWFEPSGVVDRLHEALRRTRRQQEGRTPQVLGADDEERVLALAPRIQRAARDLRAAPFPSAFQHGDLHPNNVFADGLRVFDLGDAMWANALGLLCVPLRFAATALHPVLEDAFLAAWDRPVGTADLRDLVDSARLVDTVDRALVWAGALDEASDAEWTHWVPRAHEMLPAALHPWLPRAAPK